MLTVSGDRRFSREWKVSRTDFFGEIPGSQEDLVCSEAQDKRQDLQKKRWDNLIPWMRFIMCFTNDEVKEKFLQRHNPLNRQELDARGSTYEPLDYRHYVAEMFNNPDVVFEVPAMPDIHEDFSEVTECPLTVQGIGVEEVGKRMQNMKVLLHTMKMQWERSGSGSYMKLGEDDDNYQTVDDVYQFIDGDDRKSFLSHAQNKVYILFWWDVAYKHQLLSSAMETLGSVVAGDGSCVPSARNSKTKGGGSEKNGIEKNGIQYMADQMLAMVEMKKLDRFTNLIKEGKKEIADLTALMEKKKETRITITEQMWEFKYKLHEELKVEESAFFSVSTTDSFAVKMYKSKLSGKKQEEAAADNDILDYENKIETITEDIEEIRKEQEIQQIRKEEEIRISKNKHSNENGGRPVPTSVRKRRRGEGGISAALSTTSGVTNPMADDVSYDGSSS